MNIDRKTGTGVLVLAALLAARALIRRRKHIDLHGASVVIAGGSRGLGLELAREFGRRGAVLTLIARDEEELDRAEAELEDAGISVMTLPCDVTDPEMAVNCIHRVMDARGRIDVLVNAAGIIQVGPLDNMDESDFVRSMDTHFWGPLRMSREVVPIMKAQGGGRIVNISSIGGLVSVPHLLPYSAGKFALTGLSEGLRSELVRHGIYVTTVWPGLMRTGSHVNARFKGRNREEFGWFALSSASPLLSTTSRRAARAIVRSCLNADAALIITPQAKLLHLIHSVMPNTTASLMQLAARLLPGPGEEQLGRYGWESRSNVAPSALTWPADKNIARNNELTAEAAAVYFSQPPGNGKKG